MEEPPPLDGGSAPPPLTGTPNGVSSSAASDGPDRGAAAAAQGSFVPLPVSDSDGGGERTVMDEMLEIAKAAQMKKKAEQSKARHEEAQAFGKGMKGGFFAKKSKSKSKPQPQPKAAALASTAGSAPGATATPAPAKHSASAPSSSSAPAPAPAPAILELDADGGFDLDASGAVDVETELQACRDLKSEGNACFKAGRWQDAVAQYDAALGRLPQGGVGTEVAELAVSLHSNSALCHAKLGEHAKAIAGATAAIEHSPNGFHAKALYRRALSRQALGAHAECMADLERFLRADPANKAAQRAMQRSRDALGGGSGGGGGSAIPTIRPHNNDGSGADGASGLQLPEVQAAMAGSNPMAEQLKKGDWVNQDLMQAMASNPRLVMGMQNPHYKAVLDKMQTDPTGAMKECEKDPGLKAFIQEWMGVMSQHFDKLGEKQQQKQAPAAPPQSKEEAMAAAAANDPEVQKVLANRELAEMLQDPVLRKKLEACGDPATLRRHMQDADFRSKVQKLKEAGLIQIQL